MYVKRSLAGSLCCASLLFPPMADAQTPRCAEQLYGITSNGEIAYSIEQPPRQSVARIHTVDLNNGQESVITRANTPWIANRQLTDYPHTYVQVGASGLAMQRPDLGYDLLDLQTLELTPLALRNSVDLPGVVVGRTPPQQQLAQGHIVGFPWPTPDKGMLRVNLVTGAIEVVGLEWPTTLGWWWNYDGHLAARVIRSDRFIPTLEINESGEWSKLAELEELDQILDYHAFMRDSASPRLYILRRRFNQGPILGEISLDTGEFSEITPSNQDATHVQLHPNTGEFLWARLQSPRSGSNAEIAHVYFATPQAEALFRTIEEALDEPGERYLQLLAAAETGHAFTITSSDLQSADQRRFIAVDTRTGLKAALCETEVSPTDEASLELFSVTANDGVEVYGRQWTPRDPDRQRGTILHIHGGPRASAPRSLTPIYRHLLAEGFSVANIDYRGSTGRGTAFIEAGNLEYDDGMLADIEAALDRLVERRSGPLIVMGESFGGYLALSSSIRFSNSISGVIAIAPLTDLTDENQVYGLTPTRPSNTYYEELLGLSEVSTEARLRDASPVYAADDIDVPVLLFHGSNDLRITPNASLQMAEALENAGGKPRLHIIEGADHQLSCESCEQDLLESLSQFLDEIQTR